MKIFNLILFALILNSCQNQEEKGPSINDYDWFVGTWYAHGLDFFEEWKFKKLN